MPKPRRSRSCRIHRTSAATVALHPTRVNSCEWISGRCLGGELALIHSWPAVLGARPELMMMSRTQQRRRIQHLVVTSVHRARCEWLQRCCCGDELDQIHGVGLVRVVESGLMGEAQAGARVSRPSARRFIVTDYAQWWRGVVEPKCQRPTARFAFRNTKWAQRVSDTVRIRAARIGAQVDEGPRVVRVPGEDQRVCGFHSPGRQRWIQPRGQEVPPKSPPRRRASACPPSAGRAPSWVRTLEAERRRSTASTAARICCSHGCRYFAVDSGL